MMLKRKTTKKTLFKEPRTCYKARETSFGRLGDNIMDFEIYEISKSDYLVFINGIKRFETYDLGHATTYCMGRAGYFKLVNE